MCHKLGSLLPAFSKATLSAMPLSFITLLSYSDFTSSRKPSIVNPISSPLFHLHLAASSQPRLGLPRMLL